MSYDLFKKTITVLTQYAIRMFIVYESFINYGVMAGEGVAKCS